MMPEQPKLSIGSKARVKLDASLHAGREGVVDMIFNNGIVLLKDTVSYFSVMAQDIEPIEPKNNSKQIHIGTKVKIRQNTLWYAEREGIVDRIFDSGLVMLRDENNRYFSAAFTDLELIEQEST